MAAKEEWRQCAEWLIRCQVLPDDHRVTFPSAEVFDLAQTLRDGVLICHLLNNLYPGAIDLKDFSQRPQMSQFLCLRNICAFLTTCKNIFGMKDQDLFDRLDLFDVKDFGKVIHTLSKLSKTELAQRSLIPGFPESGTQLNHDHDYYNTLEELATGFPPERRVSTVSSYREDEDIYRSLEERASENDLADAEELYDTVYVDDEDDIYEDLCIRRRKKMPEIIEPKTKRDHCLKELIETEKNYIDALNMIQRHFIKPLKSILSQQDREIIFKHIEDLSQIHAGFQSDLQQAVKHDKSRLGQCFITWKRKLLIYGDFCSNLPQAQERIDDICKRNEIVKLSIEQCQKEANEGKFRLRDLLSVPMQRVLKYHLLLKELIKQTDRSHEDRPGLQEALDAMQDLSLYVNEVKRDNEALELIRQIQDSIVDLQMPENTALKDYGRLLKDGELKMKSHDNHKLKSRYIFLFDKVMLMCRQRGENYNYKHALVLAQYKVDEGTNAMKPKSEKWSHMFILVEHKNATAYTFYAKTDDMRRKWIDAINMALDNTNPQGAKNNRHDFLMHTYNEPTTCTVCNKLLRGVFFQGYSCQNCKSSVHKECITKAKTCQLEGSASGGPPSLPPRLDRPSSVRHTPPTTPTHRMPQRPSMGKVKATEDYNGTPSPGTRVALLFRKGDVMELLSTEDSYWWEGRFQGNEGFFPANKVIEHRRARTYKRKASSSSDLQHMAAEAEKQRAPSYLDTQPRHVAPVTVPGETSPPLVVRPPARPPTGSQNNMADKMWFVGVMSRETAMSKLEPHPTGCYLIRESNNPVRRGEYALSIKFGTSVKHIKVNRSTEGQFFLADCKYFRSIPELVEFYQKNSLVYSFPELNTTLQLTYRESVQHNKGAPSKAQVLGYATASFDYAATAPNQISLKKNDRVAIISKAGGDKGWWKGELGGKIGYFPAAYVTEEEEDIADGLQSGLRM